MEQINNEIINKEIEDTKNNIQNYKKASEDLKNRIKNYEIHMKSMNSKYSAAVKLKLILENLLTKRKAFSRFFLKKLYENYQNKKFEEYAKSHPNDESDEYTSDEETKQDRLVKQIEYKKKYEKFKNKDGHVKLSNLLRHKEYYIKMMYNRAKNNYKIPNFDMMARMELDKKKKELEYSGLSKKQKAQEIEKYKLEIQEIFKKIYKNKDMVKWNDKLKELEEFKREFKDKLDTDIPLSDVTTDIDQNDDIEKRIMKNKYLSEID